MILKKKYIYYSNDKCITIPEFNKLTAEKFAAGLAQAILLMMIKWKTLT